MEKPDQATAETCAAGRLLLEQRHVYVQGKPLPRRAQGLSLDIFNACSKTVANVKSDLILFEWIHGPSLTTQTSRLTMPRGKYRRRRGCSHDVGWSDIGSGHPFGVSAKKTTGNVKSGDVMLHEVRNSFIGADDKLVAAVGINDIVVVSTKDALLVAHKDSAQDMKLIADKLRNDGRWGRSFIVKSIVLGVSTIQSITAIATESSALRSNQVLKLSVQMHHHRAEHCSRNGFSES